MIIGHYPMVNLMFLNCGVSEGNKRFDPIVVYIGLLMIEKWVHLFCL